MRQDQYSVTVEVDGQDLGVWDKLSGGTTDSDESKYKPGGMAPEITLGGTVSTDNLTVSRLYELERDHTIAKTLIGKVGRADMAIKKQPLNPEGVPFGMPLVYRGKLKACTPPEVDSESSDAALIELEMSTAGTVG